MKNIPIWLMGTALLLSLLMAPAAMSIQAAPLAQEPDPTPLLRGTPIVATAVNPSNDPPVGGGATAVPVAPVPAASTSPRTTPEAVLPTPIPNVCAPNFSMETACLLDLDSVHGPFQLIGNQRHWYRLSLPQQQGLQTTITARATSGLDLVLTVMRADQHHLARTAGKESSVLTLDPEVTGDVFLRVENQGPTVADTDSYRLILERTVPEQQGDSVAYRPDALENNYDPDRASLIAFDTTYTLSLVCPDTWPGACPGGDHDYLRVPVKAGQQYLLTTFDLGPGVDTVLDLFWGDRNAPVATSDDTGPSGFLSTLLWTAPADGDAILRVGPRHGDAQPQLTGDDAKFATTYRLVITHQDSPLAEKLWPRLRQQAGLPEPTPVPTPGSMTGGPGDGNSRAPAPVPPAPVAPPASAGAAASVPQTQITPGQAIVRETTSLRVAPNEDAEIIALLAPETIVSVKGPAQGIWVQVEVPDSVLPGWVRGTQLQRSTGDATPVRLGATAVPGVSQGPTARAQVGTLPSVGAGSRPADANGTTTMRLRPLDVSLPPPAAAIPVRETLQITAQIVYGHQDRSAQLTSYQPTATPVIRGTYHPIRVQLVDALGTVLVEAMTDGQGRVSLRRDIDPTTRLFVRLPAIGADIPIQRTDSFVTLLIPEATHATP